ncbi:Hint domain-containing protein [Oceaniglobus trochenteri]|uniref:Hint domain-containing protein n=1 Tax=Oceaniglobus trochenteri TaxID=2763260 RepID=UPI001CFF8A67|nr:Hint domain-containing protein [Oceaniglobus trochenteri]
MFAGHEVVNAAGALTESLFTGPQAIKSVSREAREEIFSLFPGLRKDDAVAVPAARIVERAKEVKELLHRSNKNGVPLVVA